MSDDGEVGGRVRLLRLRNPWGQGHGEWRGAWSDGAAEWQAVSAAHRRQLDVRFDPDGEFWMSLDDYVRYFQTTSGVRRPVEWLLPPVGIWALLL